MTVRFKLPPGGDVPPDVAARRLGLSPQAFALKLDALTDRGFPAPDPTTGNFDLDAIDAWRRRRHPQLFSGERLLLGPPAREAHDLTRERLRRVPGG